MDKLLVLRRGDAYSDWVLFSPIFTPIFFVTYWTFTYHYKLAKSWPNCIFIYWVLFISITSKWILLEVILLPLYQLFCTFLVRELLHGKPLVVAFTTLWTAVQSLLVYPTPSLMQNKNRHKRHNCCLPAAILNLWEPLRCAWDHRCAQM